MNSLELKRKDRINAVALEDVLRERNPQWTTYGGIDWQVVSWDPDIDVSGREYDDDREPF